MAGSARKQANCPTEGLVNFNAFVIPKPCPHNFFGFNKYTEAVLARRLSLNAETVHQLTPSFGYSIFQIFP
jgi:hypothetical protein